MPLEATDPDSHFWGRLRIDGNRIDSVRRGRYPPPSGVTQVDTADSYVYPGLVDLHSHVGYAALPMWFEPSRPLDRPWLNRNNWPNADSYKENVSWPGYAYMKGAPQALLAYAQVRALAGGTTVIQGWPSSYGSLVNKLVRNVDDDIDPDRIRTSVLNLNSVQLADRSRHFDEAGALIYHLSEGQLDSTVRKEFGDAARASCLRHRLFAIHCNAVGPEEFAQWKSRAQADDGAAPGGVVWSPLSNLWLYGQTTDVVAARANDVTVTLGSDWGPSGSKNLLGEMKVALLHAQRAGLALTEFDLVEMATAGPCDLLDRVEVWRGFAPGRLEPGRAADAVVVARRDNDPWTNLVMARERDVRLVVVDGEPRYGERELMRAAGVRSTTSVPVDGERRHVPLRTPSDLDRTWTWTKVVAELATVRADPMKAIANGMAQAYAAYDRYERGVAPPRGEEPLLVLEPDMPGGTGHVAGPPPADAVFEVPPLPSVAHDRTWLRSVRQGGYDHGLLAQLEGLYRT